VCDESTGGMTGGIGMSDVRLYQSPKSRGRSAKEHRKRTQESCLDAGAKGESIRASGAKRGNSFALFAVRSLCASSDGGDSLALKIQRTFRSAENARNASEIRLATDPRSLSLQRNG